MKQREKHRSICYVFSMLDELLCCYVWLEHHHVIVRYRSGTCRLNEWRYVRLVGLVPSRMHRNGVSRCDACSYDDRPSSTNPMLWQHGDERPTEAEATPGPSCCKFAPPKSPPPPPYSGVGEPSNASETSTIYVIVHIGSGGTSGGLLHRQVGVILEFPDSRNGTTQNK